MKTAYSIATAFLILALIIAIVSTAAEQDPAFLTDDTGSLFRPTNLARSLRAIDAGDVRGGSTVITLGETTHAVSFNRPMQDATYIVLATPSGATGVSVPVASKTTNGFTINLTVGINGRVDWLAINP